jgi:hypothetical protein
MTIMKRLPGMEWETLLRPHAVATGLIEEVGV